MQSLAGATERMDLHEQHTRSKNRHCHNRVKARSRIFQHSLWGKEPGGVGTGKEGEKRPSDHISTIIVIKIKVPENLIEGNNAILKTYISNTNALFLQELPHIQTTDILLPFKST